MKQNSMQFNVGKYYKRLLIKKLIWPQKMKREEYFQFYI